VKQSCWGCYYEYKRHCYWFQLFSDSTPKLIPNDVLDKGCSKYENTSYTKSETIKKIIELTDGEIISDKYKKKKFYRRTKKTYKSSHNYTHRKDAQ